MFVQLIWRKGGEQRTKVKHGRNSLGTLVDETELAEEADETAVLEFAHELVFETVDTAVIECPSAGQHRIKG